MYYELGTMVAIEKDASPFVDHDKGISIPSIDVVGEIVGIRPTILSYAVRLSKKYVLTFNEDDIYRLPGWMSDKHYMFHKMLGSIAADVHPFYYVKEFEDYVSRAEGKQSTMYFPGYHFTPARRPLKALEELNRREFERIAASPIRIDIDDAIKAHYSEKEIKKMINLEFGWTKSVEIKKVIFNGPCTIILWEDGTKTIAKASGEEAFDPEKGVAICFMKKLLGHTETNKILRKASKDFYDEIAREANKSLDEELKKTTFPLPKGVTFRPFTFDTPIDTNKVIKVKEEKENNNLAIGSRCSTCKYYDRPMTADPCSYCISDDQYKKREETKMDFRS